MYKAVYTSMNKDILAHIGTYQYVLAEQTIWLCYDAGGIGRISGFATFAQRASGESKNTRTTQAQDVHCKT
jgi:hypothetical protein